MYHILTYCGPGINIYQTFSNREIFMDINIVRIPPPPQVMGRGAEPFSERLYRRDLG